MQQSNGFLTCSSFVLKNLVQLLNIQLTNELGMPIILLEIFVMACKHFCVAYASEVFKIYYNYPV